MMKTRRVDRITTQGGQIRLSHVGWIEKTTTVGWPNMIMHLGRMKMI